MWRVFWVRLGAPYLCVWSGHLAAGRFLCTAPGPVAVSVFCVCLGSLWGVFCVRPGAQWRDLFWVQLGAVAWVFCVLSGLRACCGARVLWVSGLLGGASFARRSGPISRHGWGRWCAWLSVGACPVGAWEQWCWRVLRAALGFPVCYEVDSSPLFNFNRIFPPFPGACETSAQKPLI